jgi:RNA polymerase sigma-70 factor (ECF subfamily)
MSAEAPRDKENRLAGLYDEYYNRIARYAFSRTGNRETSEDIAGETFLKALQALPGYDERGLPMGAWLFRIAHNLVVDYLRQKSRHPVVNMDFETATTGLDPEEMAETTLELERVEKAMKELSPSQQEVIRLRFIAGMNCQETAQLMQKSNGAVREMQHEALEKLRHLLSDERNNV